MHESPAARMTAYFPSEQKYSLRLLAHLPENPLAPT